MIGIRNTPALLAAALVSSALLLAGCGSSQPAAGTATQPLRLDMDLPASLTGGTKSATLGARAVAQSIGQPCAFNGADEEDPLRNGYEMTKFMVSAVATWTCIADLLIEIAGLVPHDGVVRETDNDTTAPDYDPDDPTHYSVSDDSPTQTTIRMYYGFERANPPGAEDTPQFFISWHEEANGDTRGRMIIDASTIDAANREVDDPTRMRLDFDYSMNQETADMFLRFDAGNTWAEGFRIEVVKDLNASPLEQVFTARGLLAMRDQFAPVTGIDELPQLKMFTVADRFGEGAASAIIDDLSLPLALNETNHLGDYLFSKTDLYFFDADQSADDPWDWIEKQVSRAEYRGNRTTPATGGSWIPFDPSLDLIIAALQLDAGYFTGTQCAGVGDDCTALLNKVLDDGFAGQESNQGADPLDWRSTALSGATYLASVYPNGLNWDGAFDLVFNP